MKLFSRASAPRRWIAVVAMVAATTVQFGVGLATPALSYDITEHTIFQGDPTPMGQTNGTVYAVAIGGGKIFAGGAFTSTRPAGTAAGIAETGQAYLAAFDAASGKPVTQFSPTLANNYTKGPATVRAMALSPDKSTLYVAGDFNTINGKNSEHVAKFDTNSGDYLGEVGLNGVNGQVNALAVSNDGKSLYVGGKFNKANWGVARTNLAAFDLSTGELLPWAPEIGSPMYGWTAVGNGGVPNTSVREPLSVNALAVSSDDQRVFLGGTFQSVNGVAMQGFAATMASNGSLAPGFANNYAVPGTRGWVEGISVKDGQAYLAMRADDGGDARQEGINSISEVTGKVRWNSRCFGDSMAVLPVGVDVVVASHTHVCEKSGLPQNKPSIFHAMHTLNATSGIMRPYWVYTQGDVSNNETLQMSRALATDGDQLVMGGGFNKVNGKPQANISRFIKGSSAPGRAAWASGTVTAGSSQVQLKVLHGADYDDSQLTYELYRNATTTNPIYKVARASYVDEYKTTFAFVDNLPLGTKVFYRVKVTDPAGNSVWSVRTPTYTVGQP